MYEWFSNTFELILRLALHPVSTALANAFSVVGATIGFVLTYLAARRSRSASEQARDAVAEIKEKLHQVDVATELSAASTALEEVIRLQRLGRWDISLELLAQVRKALVRTKAATDHLCDEDQSRIQMAVQQVTAIRNSIENALPSDVGKLSAPRFNKLLNTQIDGLTEVITSIRNSLTR